jgi:hypothetical protein
MRAFLTHRNVCSLEIWYQSVVTEPTYRFIELNVRRLLTNMVIMKLVAKLLFPVMMKTF